MADNTDYLKILPLELQIHIFGYLSFDEIKDYIFVSHYVHNIIRGGGGTRNVWFLDYKQAKFYLNLITNKGRNRIPDLYHNVTDTVEPIVQAAGNIVALHGRFKQDWLTTINVLSSTGRFMSLRRLHFDCPASGKLPFNLLLQVLIRQAPSLEALEIECVTELTGPVYSGPEIKSLKYLRVIRDEGYDFFSYRPYSNHPSVQVLASAMEKLPNLTGLTLFKDFFDTEYNGDFVTKIDSINTNLNLLLKNRQLEYLGIEVPLTNYMPDIVQNSALTRLCIIESASNAGGMPSIKPTPSKYPLTELEEFHFYGQNDFIDVSKYYGFGNKLKKLYLEPRINSEYSDYEDSGDEEEVVGKLDKLIGWSAPNLEELNIPTTKLSSGRLIAIASTFPKLRTIWFNGFEEGSDMSSLEEIKNIRSIYLPRLSMEAVECLTGYGFDIYLGIRVDSYDTNINPYGPFRLQNSEF